MELVVIKVRAGKLLYRAASQERGSLGVSHAVGIARRCQPGGCVVAVGHSEIIDRVCRAGRITQFVVNAAGTLAPATAGVTLRRADHPTHEVVTDERGDSTAGCCGRHAAANRRSE